ncbi:PREDICTED: uncharacterized protein LOC109146918 [Ipomoea nil]|uniref:uncharacterized protein LOC109146918 n=1 Tax=Ipomoea nil TaxID=35883 RepID=UPI00090173DD|nr:PREDICTED: uncharacterized protein LOC109146918 [Ipomoea nil]
MTLIDDFNDALEDCQLVDLSMVGSRFTWEKGRGTETWVEERLDRAVTTTDWLDVFEEAVVYNLLTMSSDHNALVLDVEARTVRASKRSFKFESAWLMEEGCHKVVDNSWRCSLGMSFQQRVEVCGHQLWKWGGEHFRRFGNRTKLLRNRLEVLRDSRVAQDISEYLNVEGELLTLMRQEDLFWKQRSKQLWLQHGDLNTKFFHKVATVRRRKNLLL